MDFLTIGLQSKPNAVTADLHLRKTMSITLSKKGQKLCKNYNNDVLSFTDCAKRAMVKLFQESGLNCLTSFCNGLQNISMMFPQCDYFSKEDYKKYQTNIGQVHTCA
jgi:hypothetical protein